jgi:hypothetical protein
VSVGGELERWRGRLLSDAIRDISVARELDLERRRMLFERRQALRQLDSWMHHVENMLEENNRTVPEPLVREIGTFVRALNPKLHRHLQRNRTREASRVLDVLFDAQEELLPRLSETA